MESDETNFLPLLCGHSANLSYVRGHRRLCGECKSFWDLESLQADNVYLADYSLSRFHYEESVGVSKVKSLQRWLSRLSLNISDLNVCEVGFGGGWTLQYFHEKARVAYGIEILQSNIDFAVKMGIPAAHVFQFATLPEILPKEVNLWVFQDSFEHLPDPEKFLTWALLNSDQPKVLVVAPRADSLSQQILGRFWPHKLIDHQFHWSKRGLIDFFEKQHMQLNKTFFPMKYVSLKTVLAHLQHKFNSPVIERLVGRIGFNASIPFNVGEMGLLFTKK